MSVDLISSNGACRDFHASWQEWDLIGKVIDLLGGDTSGMPGSPEGESIDADDLFEWAEIIDKHLERVWVVWSDSFDVDDTVLFDADGMGVLRWQAQGLSAAPLVCSTFGGSVKTFSRFCRMSEGCTAV